MIFFPRTQIYTVHINFSKTHANESAVFVREGFNIFAFFFGVLWALYHRMWRVAFWMVIVIGFLGAAEDLQLLDIRSVAILQVAFNLVVGYWANDWLRANLSRRGYIMSDIVVSDNSLRAQQRYFDRVLAV